MATNPKPTKKRARQTALPGMEDKRIEAITDAALSYVETRDERMELTKTEKEKKATLGALMKENKLKKYFDKSSGVLVTIEPKDAEPDIKVRVKAGDDDDEPSSIKAEDDEEPIAARTMKPKKKKEKADPDEPSSETGSEN